MEVVTSLSECSTDTADNNILPWSYAGWGLLTEDPKTGLPRYQSMYPEWLIKTFGHTRPVGRWCGSFTVFNVLPQFYDIVMFDPKQAPTLNRYAVPLGAWGGMIWYFVFSSQIYHSVPGVITDLSTPDVDSIETDATSSGQLRFIEPVGNPEPVYYCTGVHIGVDNDGDTVADDGCMVVTDACGDGIDNDGDTRVDWMCGLPVMRKPPPYSGIWGSNTHLFVSNSQSYRDLDNDGLSNDEDSCPTIADGRESGAACAAGDTVDDDADTRANDGCPLVGTPEQFPMPNLCTGNADDDGDGLANDGCPPIQNDQDGDGLGDVCDPSPAVADDDQDDDGFANRQDNCPLTWDAVDGVSSPDNDEWWCDNGQDDDADGRVNDGCSKMGFAECDWNADGDCTDAGESTAAQCFSSLDDDGDGTVNDGCPKVGSASEKDLPVHDGGPPSDSIGAACDPNPNYADGDFVQDVSVAAVCLGGPDSDGDGWCDPTENKLGPGGQPLSDLNSLASVPEVSWLPGTCSNKLWYATSGDPIGNGPEIDDDGDTLANAADPNCASPAGDADLDGVPDASDNCPNDYNPEQLNSDTIAFGGGDTLGDACDLNDDGDGLTDDKEWARGSDAKNPLSPFLLDLDGSTTISGGDSLALKTWVNTAIGNLTLPTQVCLP
jgi:hypothetical protein